MKTLLICPAHRPTVARLAEHRPLVLAPILGKSLVDYWLEYLVARGDREARIIAADRPDQIRAVVGDGSRWGLQLEVSPPDGHKTSLSRALQSGQPYYQGVPPDHVVIMDHLPGLEGFPLFDSYEGWFDALQAWLPHAFTPDRIGRREIQPGVSVGLHARISASVQFNGPCWLGENVVIGADAVIGPGAILEDRAFVGSGARVAQSVIGPETFVGEMTLVERSLASGNLLINWKTRSCLDVPDAFLLSSLRNGQPAPRATPSRVKSPLMALRNLIPRQTS